MAEELIPGVCGSGAAAAGSWWCNSLPSISAPVSCSAQHTNMNGSFNWAAAITHLFDVELDIHFSQDSAQFLDSTPEEILEFGHPLFMDALVRGDGSSGILQIQEASPTESRQVMHPEILESSFLFGPLTGSTGFTSPAAALQGLAELDSQLLQQPVDHTYDQSCMNDHEDSNELSRSPIEPEPLQLLQYSSPPELQHQLLSSTNPEAPWPPNLVQRGFGESFSSSKRGTKSNSRTGGSTNCSQPAAKRPRIETPSPLPTFKVRKEKLGDRITALQQLVSPFGKTDTASVLHEAIDYIKFLHDQVRVLSSPGQKNGQQIPQTKEDLGSRGLCLVPVSATFGIAREPPVDIWSAFFGGMSG